MPTLTLSEAGNALASYALDLGDDVVRLVNPNGKVVVMFDRSESQTRIRLPAKTPAQNTIGVRGDDGAFVELHSEPAAVAALRQYLGVSAAEYVPSQTAPSIPSRHRSFARDLTIGSIIVLMGLGLSIVGVLELGRGLMGWLLLGVGALVMLMGGGWIFEANLARERSESG